MFAMIAIVWKTDKVTDLSYGLTFVVCALWLLIRVWDWMVDMLLALVVMVRWARLAGYLFVRILAIGKDKRFDGIREQRRSFIKFWILQAIVIFLLLLPVIVVMNQSGLTINILTTVGLLVAFWWVLIETLADWQKFTFKRQNPHTRMRTWLWSKARHPNYFGELLMWWGVYIACLPFLSAWAYLTIISPLSISIVLLFVTWIPPLEEQWEKKYGDKKEFQDWKKETNLLVPW